MPEVIKLSSPETKQFWEIPILHLDEDLLVLNKPAGLLASPDVLTPDQPSLLQLLHRDVERGTSSVKSHQLTYLAAAHRLDRETSGVFLLARSKTVLVQLANQFGAAQNISRFVALAHGSPRQETMTVNLKLAPHPTRAGQMRIDEKTGKRSVTKISVRERFTGFVLLECQPLTERRDQIRLHLRQNGLPVVGDVQYGGQPLLLSRLKKDYRLKPNKTERPLMQRTALHAEQLTVNHPRTHQPIQWDAPWPKDMTVALRYLRQYAGGSLARELIDQPDAD